VSPDFGAVTCVLVTNVMHAPVGPTAAVVAVDQPTAEAGAGLAAFDGSVPSGGGGDGGGGGASTVGSSPAPGRTKGAYATRIKVFASKSSLCPFDPRCTRRNSPSNGPIRQPPGARSA
jgi:hypothetical protein